MKNLIFVTGDRLDNRRQGESGNIFFTLFGALALVGIVGVATSTLMRGPVGTMMAINQLAKVESQLQIARKLAALEAAQTTNDCDGEGVVEPIAPDDLTAGCDDILGAGTGCIPATVGAAKTDPWGNLVGYCAWNHAPPVNDPGCPGLLDGAAADSSKAMIAVVSAGPDGIFQTECTSDPGYVGVLAPNTDNGDDVIVEWSVADIDANVGGGFWTLDDPNTITTGKDVKFASAATFENTATFGTGSALDLRTGGLFLLPTEATSGACNGANTGLLRRLTTGPQEALQICDGGSSTWVTVGGGGGVAAGGGNGDIQFNSGGLLDAESALDWNALTNALTVGGTMDLQGALSDSDSDLVIGDGLNVTGLADIDLTLNVDGATTLGSTLDVTGAGDFASTLNADGATTLGSTLGVTGATTLGSTLGVTGAATLSSTLDVQGNINNSVGADVTVNDSFKVTGGADFDSTLNADGATTLGSTLGVTGATTLSSTLDVQGDISDSGGDVTVNDNMVVTGNVGVGGVTVPAVDLDVGGGIKVGYEGSSCAASIHGAIRYSSGTDKIEVCSTTNAWVTVGTSGGGGGGSGSKWSDGVNAGDIYRPAGDVGIGESDPQANLHVGGTVRFNSGNMYVNGGDFALSGTYTGTAAVPVSGAGARMMFHDKMGAFRAGAVTGTQWNDANIGIYSVGMGYNATASGARSVAMGYNTTAAGNGSVVMGFSANVSGDNSAAMGLGAPAGVVPAVGASRAFGIFMGDQSGVSMGTSNIMALLGGRMVIDPAVPATQTNVSGVLDLDVEGQVGAIQYCDELGANCFTAASVAGGGGAAPGNDREVVFNSGGVFGTNANFVFTSAGRLGIGTNAPWFPLHVAGVAGIDSQLQIADSAGGNGIYDQDGDQRMEFQTAATLFGAGAGSSNLMAILSSGSVGIGDTTPDSGTGGQLKLDVEGNIGGINYCDEAGNNCFTASDIASGAVGVFEDVSGTGAGPVRATSGTINYASADFVFGSPQLADDGDATHWSRMFFDKSKGAFRAGAVAGTWWDDANIGQRSFATGSDVTASGMWSVAMGSANTASGTASVALGRRVTAGNGTGGSGFGDGSMALGLIDDAVTITTNSQVQGIQSMGIFMGDQDGLVMTAANTMGLFGGRMVIDPNVPATQLAVSTGAQQLELDVTGDIGAVNYCDANGNNCFTAAGVASGVAPGNDREMIFNSGGVLGTNANFVFTSAGRLGIGTAAPGTRLHARTGGGTNATVLEGLRIENEDTDSAGTDGIGSALTFYAETETADTHNEFARIAGVADDAANASRDGSLRFYTVGPNASSGAAASERIRIDSSGNVGIGTASPSSKLHISGDVETSFRVSSATGTDYFNSEIEGFRARGTVASPAAVVNNDAILGIWANGYDGNSYEVTGMINFEVDGTPGDGDMPGRIEFHTTADGTAGVPEFTTPEMVIKNNGNVGIGTATPSAKLHVGNGTTTSADIGAIFLQSGNGAGAARDWKLYSDGTGNFAIRDMGFDNAGGGMSEDAFVVREITGNVGLGTNAPDSRLDVVGPGNVSNTAPHINLSDKGNALYGSRSDTDNLTGGTIDFRFGASESSGVFSRGFVIRDETAGANRFFINPSGNVGIGTITPSAALDVVGDIEITGHFRDLSDIRMKDNIKPLDAKDVIGRLSQVNTYSFHMKGAPAGDIELGVIAQEIEKVFPELVHTADDEMGTKSVNYIGFIAPLIEASKELKSENDALRGKIEKMESERADIHAALNELKAGNEKLAREVNGLKAHTGYGINKAQMGFMLLLSFAAAAALAAAFAALMRGRGRKGG